MKTLQTIRAISIGALIAVLLALPWAMPTAIAQFTGIQGINTQSCSGTMTLGGTAQNAFTVSGTRRGFTIVNLSLNPMWINPTGTAAIGTEGSVLLAAGSATVQGGSFTSPIGMGVQTALSVVSATTADKFTCWFW